MKNCVVCGGQITSGTSLLVIGNNRQNVACRNCYKAFEAVRNKACKEKRLDLYNIPARTAFANTYLAQHRKGTTR